MSIPNDFGRRVRAAIAYRGISLEAFAVEVNTSGMSASTIRAWIEKGHRPPPLTQQTVVELLAKVSGLPGEFLRPEGASDGERHRTHQPAQAEGRSAVVHEVPARRRTPIQKRLGPARDGKGRLPVAAQLREYHDDRVERSSAKDEPGLADSLVTLAAREKCGSVRFWKPELADAICRRFANELGATKSWRELDEVAVRRLVFDHVVQHVIKPMADGPGDSLPRRRAD